MGNRIRRYILEHLDKTNVQRSLQGAVKRSDNGRVVLSFCTKSAVLPDEYDQCKIPDGGAYLEVYSDGQFWKDHLHIIIFGYGNNGNDNFESDMGIKLSEIDGQINVSYEEPVKCRDFYCESRDDCPHSKPHAEIEECQYVCGADEPCSRCYPVEVA